MYEEEGPLNARSPEGVDIIGASYVGATCVLTLKLLSSCHSASQQDCVQLHHAQKISVVIEPAFQSVPRIFCDKPASPSPPSPPPLPPPVLVPPSIHDQSRATGTPTAEVEASSIPGMAADQPRTVPADAQCPLGGGINILSAGLVSPTQAQVNIVGEVAVRSQTGAMVMVGATGSLLNVVQVVRGAQLSAMLW